MVFDFFFFERLWTITRRGYVVLVLFFLIVPIIAVVPLSFNAEPFFTYPMPGLSLQWYTELFSSDSWQRAIRVSFTVGLAVTVLATFLGTFAALGLTMVNFRLKALVIGLLVSPIMVPHLITGVGMFFLYAWAGVIYTIWGLILAHTVLALPFVILTVTATLANFNVNLIRAGANLGANPMRVFFRIILPLILPGVLAGAVLAFVASFDELIIAILISGADYKTIPRQMWSGVREEFSPVITAAATVLIGFSILVMGCAEALRRRITRLRGARQF
ncbi:MAG: ABC transporter permease [Rhodospirillales bacterium]|jgi:putative spermidine/putrescine transport system permease protein|nr:ABC transporter permease [Rhodospirillales bacterium]